MGLRVYWELCKKYGLDRTEKWYEEVPNNVRVSEDGKTEIWWDKDVYTTEVVGANRPDLTLINHEEKVWTFADFAVPLSFMPYHLFVSVSWPINSENDLAPEK